MWLIGVFFGFVISVLLGGYFLGFWCGQETERKKLKDSAPEEDAPGAEPEPEPGSAPLAPDEFPTRRQMQAEAERLAKRSYCHDRRCDGYGKHQCHDLDCGKHGKLPRVAPFGIR